MLPERVRGKAIEWRQSKDYRLSIIRQISIRDVMYNMINILNTAVSFSFFFLFFFFFLVFLGPHLWHMEAPRPGVEVQLPAYAKATAMPDWSRIFDLHHSLQQCQNRNPLSEAGDRTCILMVTSQIHFCWAMMGTPCCMLYMKIVNTVNSKSFHCREKCCTFLFL